MLRGEAFNPASEVTVLVPLNGRKESLTGLVYEAIRDAIVTKALVPGSRLSEAGLAEQLNVSKTPVREALLRLQAIGLVANDDGRGARVVQPSRELIQHAYELRAAHEMIAARLAAERATGDDIARLASTAESSIETAKARDARGFRQWDLEFHRAVAAAHNPLLESNVENSFALTWALRRRDAPVTGDSVACANQHLRITRAIRRREAIRAGDEMLAHVDKVKAIVLAAFGGMDTSSV